MKKSILLLAIVMFHCLLCPLKAQADTNVEFRVAAFIPTNERFRDVYGDIGPNYQIEVTEGLCGCMQGWVNFDFFTDNGHKNRCGHSEIDIYTLSVGPKWVYPSCGCFDAYLGFGLNIGAVSIHNKSCFGKSCESEFAYGVVLKSGLNYDLTCNVVLDLLCDYIYQNVHFHKNENIGGFKMGAGLGYRF